MTVLRDGPALLSPVCDCYWDQRGASENQSAKWLLVSTGVKVHSQRSLEAASQTQFKRAAGQETWTWTPSTLTTSAYTLMTQVTHESWKNPSLPLQQLSYI
ncbi:hypothetical protein D4764_10G0003840 [Takifugu flavidus]|uniref:Uncharacterized protein n=1 Tax=Takifugu flavidus TaxID=433684 RepID=A0A5C6PHT7_9TELE|nr:hypothetical protein D4764_10G0003840 [Takifugu flavidus]